MLRIVLVLLAAAVVAPTAAAARTHRVVVHFAPHASARDRAHALAAAGIRDVRSVAPGYVVGISADPRAALDTLSVAPAVAGATRDAVATFDDLTPNDPDYLTSDYAWNFTKTQVPGAWALTTGSSSIAVAVLDSGLDTGTTDLSGALLPGWNVAASNSDVTDTVGHGTTTASLIGARIDNGVGIAGICGGCRIIPVKVSDAQGNIYLSNVAQGVTWATDHGADIINMSLGGQVGDGALAAAIQYAQSHGVLVVASAGNSGAFGAEYPAAYPGVISVEATDANDNLYSWSNHGPGISLGAPGCVRSIKPGNVLATVCGTSYSSPFVAGVAALVESYVPGISAADVSAALEHSADRHGDSEYGRVNALKALQLAAGQTAPVNVTVPTIAGTLLSRSTLTASPGTWLASQSLSYQWQRAVNGAWQSIAGATSSAYVLADADAGKKLRVLVTATNGAGQTTVSSAPTAAVAAFAAPVVTVRPAITGTLRSGSTLTASPGTWTGTTPMSFSYQWQSLSGASWAPVSGATGKTFVPTVGDRGLQLRVAVTASNVAGTTTSYSNATAIVPTPPANTTVPAISGTVRAGETLTATSGAWSGTTPMTYAYQWLACSSSCAALAGATKAAYVVPAGAVGMHLEVSVTASNAGGQVSATSAQTAAVAPPVAPASTAAPVISGAVQFGSTLSVTTGSWTGTAPMTYAFQWRVCSSGSCANVAGATAQTFKVTTAYATDTFVAVVTAKNMAGQTSATSLQTAAAPPLVAPANTVAPSIGGTVKAGGTLTAAPGTWTGTAPISYTFQWQACSGAVCTAVSGATSASFVIPSQYGTGYTFVVVVTARNVAGSASATSAPKSA